MGKVMAIAVFCLGLALNGMANAQDAALPRVASASLCADQYILALADPSQITSLSKNATGPLSAQADKAADHRRNRGALEEFLAMDTDLVLLDSHDAPQLRRVLPEFGIQVHELANTLTTFEDVFGEIRRVGRLLGRPTRAEELVVQLETRLDAVKRSQGDDQPLISYFRPDGGGAGAGTFVNEVLQTAGFENLQVKLDYPGWGRIPMEELVLTPPPGGITSFFDTSPESARSRFGTNAFYRKLAREDALFGVPRKFWPCSGPMLVEAAEMLAAARASGFPNKVMPDADKAP